MRIGIDARLNAYREGGIAEYTRRLIEWLPRLDDQNSYQVLEHTRSTASLIPDSAPNFKSKRTFTPPHNRLERIALSAEVAPLRLDVLHSPDFIPPRFGPRCKLITVHDLTFMYYPAFQTADANRYYNGHIRMAVQEAAHILADSEATRTDLNRLLNVPPEKVTVHLLGVNEAYRPLESDSVAPVMARYSLTPGYLLFVGTFEPRKNLPGLLSAYHALRSRRSDTPPLVIVGRRGWLYEDIFKKVQELRLEDSVRWIENVPFADMPALYNGASVLALVSHYEGFGFPALEAMACGIPTVVSDRGSLPEVVGDTGLLIDPDEPDSIIAALETALSDSAFRARSRSAGMARARQFEWRRTAEIVLDAYRRVGAG